MCCCITNMYDCTLVLPLGLQWSQVVSLVSPQLLIHGEFGVNASSPWPDRHKLPPASNFTILVAVVGLPTQSTLTRGQLERARHHWIHQRNPDLEEKTKMNWETIRFTGEVTGYRLTRSCQGAFAAVRPQFKLPKYGGKTDVELLIAQFTEI